MKLNILTRSLSLLLIVFTMCTSCSACSKKGAQDLLCSQKELGYGKVMKDSIASIIFEAKSVTCELQSKNPADTLRQDSIIKVPSKYIPTLQYLFANPDNFQSNDTVFAKFNSWVCYKFEAKKKQVVYLEMDFGIRKWRLLDSKKKVICGSDMKENNMQFIYFTRLLFPKDKTLELLNNNLKAIKK